MKGEYAHRKNTCLAHFDEEKPQIRKSHLENGDGTRFNPDLNPDPREGVLTLTLTLTLTLGSMTVPGRVPSGLRQVAQAELSKIWSQLRHVSATIME